MFHSLRLLTVLSMLFLSHAMYATDIIFVAGTDTNGDEGKPRDNAQIQKEGVTIKLSRGTLGRPDSYRCYSSQTMTVSSSVGNITKISIYREPAKNDGYSPENFKGMGYTFKKDVGIWTGNTKSVQLEAKRSLVQMTKIVVTLDAGNQGVTISVGDSGYATLYYGNTPLVVPENVKAFSIRVNGNRFIMSHEYVHGETIPAGTAVVLCASKGTYRFIRSMETGVTDNKNMLLGTDENILTPDDGNSLFYQLSLDKDNTPGTVGFYWENAAGAAFTNGAHKAYLKVSKNAGAKTCYLFNDETTHVAYIGVRASDTCTQMFNLAGQKIDRSYRGVVIQQGKKFILN